MDSSNRKLPLDQLKRGEKGTIIDLLGGNNFIKKLDALGIRSGKEVTKISNMVMNGPVTVKVDNTRVAIGRGMAKKIIVKL